MDEFVYDIEKISFGVYSPDEIKKMSVCLVDNPKKTGYGTVYDERMGTIEFNKKCETCNLPSELCHGHFGHIELNEPIINPLYYKHAINFLKCVCLKCNKLLITRENIELLELDKCKGYDKFIEIFKKIQKIDMCYQIDEKGDKCGYNQPNIKLNTDNTISLSYNKKTEIILSVRELKKIFEKVKNEDIIMLGFDPKLIHPRNLIIVNLPVLPICDRPYVKCDSSICDDDLTNQYIEIVKLNNNIKKQENTEKKRKDIYSLEFRVSTMFNNSKGKAKHTTSSRSIKGIKERIVGKDGLIRNNMMGKRVNQSARTVIGPDPNLKTDQLAVPYKIAETLTIPEIVTRYNLDKMNNLLENDKINYVIKKNNVKINIEYATKNKPTELLYKDIICRGSKKIKVFSGREELQKGDKILRDGKFLENISYPARKKYILEYGDIVERQLQNGDLVLLNRQPTLHKGSMIAMEVVLKPHKTLRMNLACTKSFNADFDGDEMNLHVPQSIEAIVELKYLSKIQNNIISPQGSKTNIVIVQDSLLGAYKMTKDNTTITKEQFFNISMKIERYKNDSIFKKMKHIRKILKLKNKPG
jgi:DNA-directed RNA polymerase beta' subunit